MVGLIWFVQIVHYPLFAKVGRDGFRHYEMEHQRLTTYVVAPLMFIELSSSIMLLWWRPAAVSSTIVFAGISLLGLIWLVTYIVQIPQHASLILSYDASMQRQLVSGNWIRTVAWSARGLLVLGMVGQVIASVSSATPTVPLAVRIALP